MEKTNFTFVKALRCLFLPLMMLFSFNVVNAQLACNDNVQVSVPATPTDGTCTVTITADMISEANDASNWVAVFDGPFAAGTAGAPAVIAGASQYFGDVLTVRVYEGATATGNFCWGSVVIEDKAAPVCNISTTPVEIDCAAAVPAAGFGVTAADNCTPASAISIELTDESTNDDDNCTAGTGANAAGVVVITRTYVAIDAQGNVSAPCTQTININRSTDVDFPEDISWSCDQYATYNNITGATAISGFCNATELNDDDDAISGSVDGTQMTSVQCLSNTGSGVPSVANGTYCQFAVTSSDDVLELCGNNPNDNLFKIIRTWSVLDWCTSTVVTTGTAAGVDVDGNEDNIQIIKVVDVTEVVITVAAANVSANVPGAHPQPCKSTGALPIPTLSDNCDATPTYQVYTPIGQAVDAFGNGFNSATDSPFIPSPGLPVGPHNITYVATDACGNTSEVTIVVTVVDDITPSPVCDEITQVAIGSNGIATVLATTFDDGSTDNCGIDTYTVRKMGDDLCDAGTNPNDNLLGNEAFDGDVTFCCDEIGTTVNVILRVTDYYGNFNDCMVEVLVEDKIAPTRSCPANAQISCENYFNNYAPALDVAAANGETNPQILIDNFGDATFADNCDVSNSVSFAVNVNTCGIGSITRTWFNITDPSGNTASSCTQTIDVYHINDWSIAFPTDVDLTCEVGSELDGEDLGEPVVYEDNCELIAISIQDETFNIVPDACYKIIRTYTAINWCVYDGNESTPVNNNNPTGAGNDDRLRTTFGPTDSQICAQRGPHYYEEGGADSGPLCADLYDDTDVFNTADDDRNFDDGIIVYYQVIKVQDDVAPVITNPGTLDYCIDGTTAPDGNCDRDVELPVAQVSDCDPNTDNLTVTYTVAGLGTGRFYTNVVPGTYTVVVTAEDNCGNQSSINYDFVVRDCKAPTPYCVGGLVVELMPTGMVDTWASDFNAGSFDNCTATGDLKYFASLTNSFVAAQASTGSGNSLTLTCDQAGQANPVYLFVQDQAGNVDVCQSSVFVESTTNTNPCGLGDDPVIAGALTTENAAPLAGATVSVNNGMATTTDVDGAYQLTATEGTDVTVTPEYNVYDNTSVTTFDLVLIKQHILTTQLLDSPYKMIAADINNNGAISAADLVAAKQVILGMATEYANNNAWTFVDASYTFPANWTLTDGYPAVTNYNDIDANQAANFVAVRVGDVNGTYGFGDDADERNSFIINANDATLVAGQEFTVEFTSAEAAVGYQFTMNFANLEVVAIDGAAENFGVFADAITVSVEEKASDKLFAVTFRATADVNVAEAIAIDSRITKAEAYNANGSMNVVLEFANAASDFALYQNTPNPVADFTVVGFNLPTAGTANITVSDMTGKVISVIDGEYAKGYNEVTLRNLPAGVLTYTLENADFTATKTMVVVK